MGGVGGGVGHGSGSEVLLRPLANVGGDGWVDTRARIQPITQTRTHSHTHTYIYINTSPLLGGESRLDRKRFVRRG